MDKLDTRRPMEALRSCWHEWRRHIVRWYRPRMLGSGLVTLGVIVVVFASCLYASLYAAATPASSPPPLNCQNTLAQRNTAYQIVGCFIAQGQQGSSMVAAGPSGSQWYYVTYLYEQEAGNGDLVAIDPTNGGTRVYAFPSATSASGSILHQQGAYAIASGPDNNLYLGTFPNAHIFQYNPAASQLTDLGTVPPKPLWQQYVYGLTTMPTGSPYASNLYGCTYPSADIVQVTTNTGTVSNLGPVDTADPNNQFAHSCVADPSPQDSHIYFGVGTDTAAIVAYDLRAQKGVVITPSLAPTKQTLNIGYVWKGADGNTYGAVAYFDTSLGKDTEQYYQLTQGTAVPLSGIPTASQDPAPTNVLANRDHITVDGTSDGQPTLCPGSICVTSSSGVTVTYPYPYQGESLDVFRLTAQQGVIYGGSIKPFYLLSCPTSGCPLAANLGYVGGGEPYQFLRLNGAIYIANYYPPDLLAFDPTQGVQAPTCPGTTNPTWLSCSTLTQTDLRPKAMIVGPDGLIYVGSAARYRANSSDRDGWTGPMFTWNPSAPNTPAIYYPAPVQSQSVVSLASATKCGGFVPTAPNGSANCVVGGTSTQGEGISGVSPVTPAQLFIWDPAQAARVATIRIPNVPNATEITDLLVNPGDNHLLYGIADVISYSAGATITTSYLFVLDLASGKFINPGTQLTGISAPIYNSIGVLHGVDGINYLWGVASNGVFFINTYTMATGYEDCASVIGSQTFTSGFAAVPDSATGQNGTLYFSADGVLWKYTVPANFPAANPPPTVC